MGVFVTGAVIWAAALSVLAAAAGFDLWRRIIPNETVLLIALAGIALGILLRPSSIGVSLLISAALLLVFLVCAHFDWLGGGDAKLLAAVTLLVPPGNIGVLLIEIALAGGLLSAVYLALHRRMGRKNTAGGANAPTWQRKPMNQFKRFFRKERIRIVSGNSVPYGLAVLGGVVVYVTSEFYGCSSATSCLL